MKELIRYYVNTLTISTFSLRKKSILVDKPWVFKDDKGDLQKVIFKRDNRLIISKNGNVSEGTWEYFIEANSLFIAFDKDKILLNEQFVDPNILILKKDGSNNDYIVLVNENVISIGEIPRYLNTLKCKRHNISEVELHNGLILQVYDFVNKNLHNINCGRRVDSINVDFIPVDMSDGMYLTKDENVTFYISNKIIQKVVSNSIIELRDGGTFEIQDGNSLFILENIGRNVTIKGQLVADVRLVDTRNYIYELSESKISRILMIVDHEMSDGTKIKIEKKFLTRLSKGDKIVFSNSVYPLPDGKYKIKGIWGRVNVKNCVIV